MEIDFSKLKQIKPKIKVPKNQDFILYMIPFTLMLVNIFCAYMYFSHGFIASGSVEIVGAIIMVVIMKLMSKTI
jgi:hypothetical protein